jgi:hypothetical protein
MCTLRLLSLAFPPALALLALAAGPGNGQDTKGDQKLPLKGKGWATLKGKVTYDGDPPKVMDFKDQIGAHKDKDHCLKGDVTDPTWRIGKDKAMANVVVFLRPPADRYFMPLPADKKSWPEVVRVDRPFCAFEPHVALALPSYFDGIKHVSSGQKLQFVNSAPIVHNIAYRGNFLRNPGGNLTLEGKKPDAKAPERDVALKPDYTTPVSLHSDIHKWMKGYVWALETPYAAVTGTDGAYTIKNVPAGAEVFLVGWHEACGFLTGGMKGEALTLKEGDNTKNFAVKAR